MAEDDGLGDVDSPMKKSSKKRVNKGDSGSDTDFQADSSEESEAEIDEDREKIALPNDRLKLPGTSPAKRIEVPQGRPTDDHGRSPVPPTGGFNINGKSSTPSAVATVAAPPKRGGTISDVRAPRSPLVHKAQGHSESGGLVVQKFRRARLPVRSPLEPTYGSHSNRVCPACLKNHPEGACELKAAGVEHCGLCGLAHFGHSRTCPHIKSETQVREMLEALKNSPEKKELVDAAMKYLRGVKGTLVQQKKRNREKAQAQAQGLPPPPATLQSQPLPTQGGQVMGRPPLVQQLSGPPPRHVPPQYRGAMNVVPGSVGSLIPGQHASQQQQQRAMQLQAQGADDRQVENALRGYLARE